MLNKYKDRLPKLFKLWSEYFEYKFTGLIDKDLPLSLNGREIKYEIITNSFDDDPNLEYAYLNEDQFEYWYYQFLYSLFNELSTELDEIKDEYTIEKINMLNQYDLIINQIESEYYDGIRIDPTKTKIAQEYNYDKGSLDKMVHIIKRVQYGFVSKLREKINLWIKQNEEINEVFKLQDGKRFETTLTEEKLMHLFIILNDIEYLKFPSKEVLKLLISNTLNSKKSKKPIKYDSLQKYISPDETDKKVIIDELQKDLAKFKESLKK